MTDTAPEIASIIRERMMALSGSQRFVIGSQMHEAARRMVLASLPPNLSPTERRQSLFKRFYSDLPPPPIIKYAAEQSISEEEALAKGMAEKGAEVYIQA